MDLLDILMIEGWITCNKCTGTFHCESSDTLLPERKGKDKHITTRILIGLSVD